jgi:hypothetical protein
MTNLTKTQQAMTYHIFIGQIDGWHTQRVAQGVTEDALRAWLGKGYRIETIHQIGTVLHEVYLVQ